MVAAISAMVYPSLSPVEYEMYSRFGLSFEYPVGMEVWEQGMGAPASPPSPPA